MFMLKKKELIKEANERVKSILKSELSKTQAILRTNRHMINKLSKEQSVHKKAIAELYKLLKALN